jgi:hypothetical protein
LLVLVLVMVRCRYAPAVEASKSVRMNGIGIHRVLRLEAGISPYGSF